MCKYLCFPKPPISFFSPLNAVQVVSDFAKVFDSFIWTPVLVCVVVRFDCFSPWTTDCSGLQGALQQRQTFDFSWSTYPIPSSQRRTYYGKEEPTDAFLLVLVFPNKPNTCCVRTDWHIHWFHCNKYQCPSVNCRSIFPIHTLGCIFKVTTVSPALTYSSAVISVCSILPKPTECHCLSFKSFPRLTDIMLYTWKDPVIDLLGKRIVAPWEKKERHFFGCFFFLSNWNLSNTLEIEIA